MNKIVFPMTLQMRGTTVGDLQAALVLFIDRRIILSTDEVRRRELSAVLRRENASLVYGEATRELVGNFQREQRLEMNGNVDEATAAAMNRILEEWGVLDGAALEFIVEGKISYYDSFPATGINVSAFDRDLRSEELLGQALTDRQGFYQIRYGAKQFGKAEKGYADLIIKAFNADNGLLASSPIQFNAPAKAVVDLTIAADRILPPSLFERLKAAATPLLDGLKIEELEEDKANQDISFLAGETGYDKAVLARYVLAHRLAQQGIQAEFWFILMGGSVYQFIENQSLDEQLSAILNLLPSLDAELVLKFCSRGFHQNEIPELFREHLNGWIQSFLDFTARLTVNDENGLSFARLALDDAQIRDPVKQKTFSALYNQYQGLTPDVVAALEKDPAFTKDEIDDLLTSFRLKEITAGDFDVVKLLKEDFKVRKPEQVRSLAKLGTDDWVTTIKAKHAEGKLKLPLGIVNIAENIPSPEIELYAKSLEHRFRVAFPTAAFHGGMDRALINGGAKGLHHAQKLSQFLAQHEAFEFLNTSVDEFLKTSVHPEFQELVKDEDFRLEMKAVQRVFKLAPNFAATDTLLADGNHSAQKIYRMGKTQFVQAYSDQPGFTPELAKQAWNSAADTYAAVVTVVGDMKALDGDGLPMALKTESEPLTVFPNWESLFKSGDLCECEHCRSVLSPAAYYADLLMFLKDRKAKDSSNTVKDVLFSRRPDLGYIELNCANALTTLPYIDVVNEVLEDAVDTGNKNDLEMKEYSVIPSNLAEAKTSVADAFAKAYVNPANADKEKIELGVDFSLSQVSPSDPDRWVVHSEDVSYLLKKNPTSPDFFAEILRNTKVSAAELRAYPQYVNPIAYEILRTAKYPMSLPFDLFGEEVRAAFHKNNLKRWDLMRTFKSTATPNNVSDADIAAEYFGISSVANGLFDEKRLILVSDATIAGQQAVWGETSSDWLNKVSNVKNFLIKTSLDYKDLLALLDLKFINPTVDIVIHHLDPSCDLDQKVIENLDVVKLDRIHRFLRLWRKLKGWKMWELDLVIRQTKLGNGSLDESFLINLFYFSQLKNRLGGKTTVEQVCALFDVLNTETRFTKLHEKREDALYQNLFLNKRLIKPLDLAFEIDPETNDLSPVIDPNTGLAQSHKFTDVHQSFDSVTGTQTNVNVDHRPAILAALGIRESEFTIFSTLTKSSDGERYINDDLNLRNLSFLWRHAWLSKLLKYKADEWKTILKLFNQDIFEFENPKIAWDFVSQIDLVKITGFTVDELNWVLSADLTAKASVKESDAAKFLFDVRKSIQGLRAEYDITKFEFLNVTPTEDEEQLSDLITKLIQLLTMLLQKLNRDEVAVTFILKTLSDEVTVETQLSSIGTLVFPINIPIEYISSRQILRFKGVMTNSQLSELDGLSVEPEYRAAIKDLYDRPRLAVKFYEPIFSVSLNILPGTIDFKSQLSPELAAKITYDAEQRLLRFMGIMSKTEQAALNALVTTDIAYRNAIDDLALQPINISPPDKRIWMMDVDLDVAIPNNNTLEKRVAIVTRMATATRRVLSYISDSLAENEFVQQTSGKLGLTESVTRKIVETFQLFPPSTDNILHFFTEATNPGAFANSNGAIDYSGFKRAFDSWFWLNRVAIILNKFKPTLSDLEKIFDLTIASHLLNFLSLPIDVDGDVAPIERFLNTSRLFRMRDTLPETGIAFFDVLDILNKGIYATVVDFALDVERLNENWNAIDVESLIGSLDMDYPTDYLLSESWERINRVFYYIANLNANVEITGTFANATMTDTHANTIKAMLRSKFGSETWLILSAEIQDILRERKRDALAAYLLSKPQPNDIPSGKWENTNDLYAYYLLDVEMSSCQLTSRLVQASGSVQLFVQRCFMGLEPKVEVLASGDQGDSAWHWWKWMRKYRVWEANRKVFLWPENWIEPELKRDRSPFFKDLENELLQNDINQYTVETAFTNYLEKLLEVAQLEVVGFYQEDDGDNTILHVFGRTKGTEPHIYYYRRYDYRQWSPWEKIELDIQGDYLIPAVVNKRLYLLWPIFMEVPIEEDNSTFKIPQSADTTFDPDKTRRRLRMQMALSEYRQGKWTAKKISTDYHESWWYDIEISKKHYQFYPIDGSEIDGRFAVEYEGSGLGNDGLTTKATLTGAFEIFGCKGIPEKKSELWGNFQLEARPEVASVGYTPTSLAWKELSDRSDNEEDFTLEKYLPGLSGNNFATVMRQTPNIFRMVPAWFLTYFDRLYFDGKLAFPGIVQISRSPVPVGSWSPFFYNDNKRTFFVLPVLKDKKDRTGKDIEAVRQYYPDLKKTVRQLEDAQEGIIENWLSVILSNLSSVQRQGIETILKKAFPLEPEPPYGDEQFKILIKRYLMRFSHYRLYAEFLQISRFQRFHFKNFYHHFVCDFIRLVYNPLKGIPALMSRETQLLNNGFRFEQSYKPTSAVIETQDDTYYPKEIVDFSPDGAYSPYNWELFFHAPLLIANALSKNQRFEEARDWYHFIFNPMGVQSALPGGSQVSKYWITKPFFETTDPQYIQQRIDNILRMLAGDTNVPDFSAQNKRDLEGQVYDWRTNPFEPHRIANYRTVAYQKTALMKYLDNLIAWGDFLFRQDNMESINEATQLYIMAAELLGARPKNIPPQAKPPVESFNELEEQFDKFSNALVEVENLVPPLPGNGPEGDELPPLPLLYFCIPRNDKLLGYWDTVADRLYKIRQCMNIEGVVRQLALFEPPIDPALLVKAVASGLDISSAIAELNAPLPLYRFNILLQKANEVCNDVKALGGALLSALEKKDAEALGLLRQGQEIELLNKVTEIKDNQIKEANDNLDGLKKNKELVTQRRDFYKNIEKINASERLNLEKLELAHIIQGISQELSWLASMAHSIPSFDVGGAGVGGSPRSGVSFGGPNVGSSIQADVTRVVSWANTENYIASMASINAIHERRWEDWKLQEGLANKEIEQIDKSIAASEIRITIAKKEYENHKKQIENAVATDKFMRSKYTNQDLYQWQIGQISGVYFQSYKLAYDLAKRAERCYRFELGLSDSSYIQFGYWDSLKKGLLSGEKLQYDLRRLETAYLEQNRREFELTKHVSLLLINPLALVGLKESGRCFFDLPEELYDLDFPGHYFRRIKSVSVTLPCVAGPYTTISCTLRLLKNSIRINTANGDNPEGPYPRNIDESGLPADDNRFVENNIPVKTIAASNAQNDSGVFELSFRDERYLPFEGAGVISQWSLELFSDLPSNNPDPENPDFGRPLRQFDYSTITDAILHIKYTAREDAGLFKNVAVTHLRNYLSQQGAVSSLRMFNLRQEFPTQWHRFLNPANPADGNIFELEMLPSLFRLIDFEKNIKINTIWLLANCTNEGVLTVELKLILPPPASPPLDSETFTLAKVNQFGGINFSKQFGGIHFSKKDAAELLHPIQIVPTDPPLKWHLKMTSPEHSGENLQKDEVEDIFLVLGYIWE